MSATHATKRKEYTVPSKVHPKNANIDGLMSVFNTAAPRGWSFESTADTELVELFQYKNEGGFLFALTAVQVTTTRGTDPEDAGFKATHENTLVFRNDIDGVQSKVQVLDRLGRHVKSFMAYEGS
jgi:hypothetical protein